MKSSIKMALGLSVMFAGAQIQASDAFGQLLGVINSGVKLSSGVTNAKPAMAKMADTLQLASKEMKEVTQKIKALGDPKTDAQKNQKADLIAQLVVKMVATFKAFDEFFTAIGDDLLVPSLNLLTIMGDAAAKYADAPQLQNALKVTKNGQVVMRNGKALSMNVMAKEDIESLHDFINIVNTLLPTLTNTKAAVTPAAITKAKEEADKKAAADLDFDL